MVRSGYGILQRTEKPICMKTKGSVEATVEVGGEHRKGR